MHATMLILAVIAIMVPSLFSHAIEPDHSAVEGLSIGDAVVMILVYALGILYTFRAGQSTPLSHEASHEAHVIGA